MAKQKMDMADLNCPIILASTSPRRVELLRNAGFAPIVMAPYAEEIQKKGELPKKMVERLAKDKAFSLMDQIMREYGLGIIIAADTTVVSPQGNKVLGKPKDRKEAVAMLTQLAGKTHTVLTGYCVLSVAREMKPETIVRVISTKVKMRKLDRQTIERYVATGESDDKAGAYGAQGRGMGLIESVTGSYSNVIGLPISDLLQDLEKKFSVESFHAVPAV